MIHEPSMEEKEQIKLDLTRELSRIVSELIDEKREELLFHQTGDDDKDSSPAHHDEASTDISGGQREEQK